ncbi:hypothetical protein DAEQUDRAFT_204951 [Daedalea quercina L-15889]|uniref:Uncharacterized protein n=1 Tax=Daedalea quercina L-15889 TaxID=1314783 RepID=A0A165R7V8_9APHY|nr:hypothetical protein DAEQUDRAFT_204951 [Daedalea quercina L-15889]
MAALPAQAERNSAGPQHAEHFCPIDHSPRKHVRVLPLRNTNFGSVDPLAARRRTRSVLRDGLVCGGIRIVGSGGGVVVACLALWVRRSPLAHTT